MEFPSSALLENIKILIEVDWELQFLIGFCSFAYIADDVINCA